jgi:hypothetical protein
MLNGDKVCALRCVVLTSLLAKNTITKPKPERNERSSPTSDIPSLVTALPNPFQRKARDVCAASLSMVFTVVAYVSR